jgi:hypothetical protein
VSCGRRAVDGTSVAAVSSVALPDALAAAVRGVVERAVAGQRPVGEHVEHERRSAARGELEHCAHHLAGHEIPHLAGCARAVVVVVAAFLDRARARVALTTTITAAVREP